MRAISIYGWLLKTAECSSKISLASHAHLPEAVQDLLPFDPLALAVPRRCKHRTPIDAVGVDHRSDGVKEIEVVLTEMGQSFLWVTDGAQIPSHFFLRQTSKFTLI